MSLFRNSKTTITLSGMYKLIDDDDNARGYVKKEDLLQIYGKLVTADDIDDNSYIEDYELSTYHFNSELVKSLPVK